MGREKANSLAKNKCRLGRIYIGWSESDLII